MRAMSSAWGLSFTTKGFLHTAFTRLTTSLALSGRMSIRAAMDCRLRPTATLWKSSPT